MNKAGSQRCTSSKRAGVPSTKDRNRERQKKVTHYTYLIIGGGMAAHAAVRGIREIDLDGSLALISEDSDPPYKRPPLSKKLWAGKRLETV
jgi:hypothetical protein